MTPLFASPFPSLDLSLTDKEHLLQTADEILGQVIRKFEAFLWRDGCKIDSAHWDLLKEREDVRVYHDRRPGSDTGKESMHQLLATGTLVSTLSDALYGELAHTTEAMRIRTAYLEDTIIDCAVLETLLEPTVDDPFQSLTVRWFAKGLPLLARTMTKPGDNVLIEATGLRQLSNGETVGFRLMHSVAFAKTPPLPDYYRTNLSMCSLWRTVSPKNVQLFMTMYLDIGDTIKFATPFIMKSTAEALVSTWKVTKCTQMKKLAWLVEQKTTFARLADAGRQSTVGEGCSVCGSKGRSTRKGIKSACAACSQYTCRSCRVKRELCVYTPDGQLMKHQTRFCLHCLTVATKLDATVVARDEAFGRAEARKEYRYARQAAIGQAMGLSPSLAKLSIDSRESVDSARYQTTMSSSSSSMTSQSQSRSQSTARANSTLSNGSIDSSFLV